MSPKKDDNDPTYQSVRGRFESWRENNPEKPSKSALGWPEGGLPLPELSEEAGKVVFTIIGLGTGLLMLVLAATAFTASKSWGAIERDGALVGYAACGLFLTISGLGCIAATLNHNFRVVGRTPAHH
jgi:hypothetical protein